MALEPGRVAADDATLIERSWREPERFAELFDRHAPAVHRYLARRLGEQVAADALAETFLAAFRRRERYDTARADALPWLYGIATNLVGQHRRDEARRHRLVAAAATIGTVAAAVTALSVVSTTTPRGTAPPPSSAVADVLTRAAAAAREQRTWCRGRTSSSSPRAARRTAPAAPGCPRTAPARG